MGCFHDNGAVRRHQKHEATVMSLTQCGTDILRDIIDGQFWAGVREKSVKKVGLSKSEREKKYLWLK